MNQENETQWRSVVGYEGFYEVSDRGNVRSVDREGFRKGRWGQAYVRFSAMPIKDHRGAGGYRFIRLCRPEKGSVSFLVHRLVAAAFIGPSNGLQVNHKDGNKENNFINNLEYCTSRQNLRHCIDVLGKKRGEGTGAASKLKEKDIVSIRSDSRILKEIAADYGVTLQAIWMVKKRKNWSHIE